MFRYIVDSASPVDVAELTELLGLNHNAIRQHLGKLVDAGLVAETTARDGSLGRPRLLYEIEVGVESRWGVIGPYERLSVLLTEMIRTGRSAVEVGREAGRRAKREVVPADDEVDQLVDAMARQGFDPEVRRRGRRSEIVLNACPFAAVATADPDTVCGMHLGLSEGLVEDTQAVVEELVRKDPRRAGCRLHLRIEPAQ